MRRGIVVRIGALALAAAGWLPRTGHAQSPDTMPLQPGAGCEVVAPSHPLALEDVIVQSICASPQARKAWADAREQAAEVGVSASAYLPALNAVSGVERDTLSTAYNVEGYGGLNQSQNSNSRYAMLNLSWVLFDFGKRNAAQRRAQQLLAAANAERDAVLQAVFFNAAQAFYALRDAHAAVEAAREIEAIARDSLAEASAKHEQGAGTLADELQARTTSRRALLDRVGAEGDERIATGVLAAAMGLQANVPVSIVATDPTPAPAGFSAGVDQLIEQAQARQPTLLAARARYEAALANVDATRAEGRPTVSLVGSLTRNNPSYQQSPQGPGGPSISGSEGSAIGLQLTIPLFDGFASGHKIARARAQADAQEASVDDARLQVALDVWKSWQSLRTSDENLTNSQALLTDARRSLEIARGRYRAGVGTFAELLGAQGAFTDAQKQRVLAVSRWHTARLRLAASLGDLGLWSIH